MLSELYAQLQVCHGTRGPQNNQTLMLYRFNNFRAQFGNGDPRHIVAGLLQSGQMSKERFEALTILKNNEGDIYEIRF